MIPGTMKGIIATLITFIMDKSLLIYSQVQPKISVMKVANKLAAMNVMNFFEKCRHIRTVIT